MYILHASVIHTYLIFIRKHSALCSETLHVTDCMNSRHSTISPITILVFIKSSQELKLMYFDYRLFMRPVSCNVQFVVACYVLELSGRPTVVSQSVINHCWLWSSNIHTANHLTSAVARAVTLLDMLWRRTTVRAFNPLNTKRRLLYLKTQFVPRSKHFSSQL